MSNEKFEEILKETGISYKKITPGTHVYCTECVCGEKLIASINSDIIKEPERCKKCNPYNPEDSCPLRDRPNYIEK